MTTTESAVPETINPEQLAEFRRQWAAERERIDADTIRNRQVHARIRILDEAGQPLANTQIDVHQLSSDFRFGCNALVLEQLGSDERNAAYAGAIEKLFNLVTTTTCMGVYAKEPGGKLRFADNGDEDWRRPPVDRVVDWAAEHGIASKGQPLLAGSWHPKWAMDQTPEEARQMYRDYFAAVAKRYGDRLFMVDVVNEAFCHRNFPLFDENYSFVDWAFAAAGEVFPAGVKLELNEYSAVNGKIRDFRGEFDRSGNYLALARRLLGKGLRLDALGMQFHMFTNRELAEFISGRRWTIDDLRRVYADYATLGIPLYITEVTIPSTLLPGTEGEALQAEIAENLYRLWFSLDHFAGITWWNLCDGAAWKKEGDVLSGLLDADLREKPVYQRLYQLIRREWTTNVHVQTDADGYCDLTGFKGEYSLRRADGSGGTGSFALSENVDDCLCQLAPANVPDDTPWSDINDLAVEGRPFENREGPFDRLPEDILPNLSPRLRMLSRMSTGMAVRFIAQSRKTHVRWLTTFIQPANQKMTLAYRGGFDLYRRAADGSWRFVANLVPPHMRDGTARGLYTQSVSTDPGVEYLLYLPSRTRLTRCEIGGPIEKVPPRIGKPIVHYGTSIVQGGLASRPGLACPATIGRLLDRETINLGFSDAGRLEIELADALSRIDAAVYIVDCGWNLNPQTLEERLEPFLRYLSKRRPDVPIILPACCSVDLEDPVMNWSKKSAETAVIAATAKRLQQDPAFASKIFYIPPEGMMPQNGDATYDHIHPNDYGMQALARRLAKAVQSVLSGTSAE